ncbi:CMP-N-acetylneuraminate-beta-galactosamide-alpha-2,3-sialyltransferase 2-like [Genypterus blacodes]|uniref:CMP-N-acetylneuraminate-beta-galactosamide- alpha-2,3-sialyltransferase 2-like n=1 Tax=Genypterus blacodes TaxID=154954 RepID=UPI003F773068
MLLQQDAAGLAVDDLGMDKAKQIVLNKYPVKMPSLLEVILCQEHELLTMHGGEASSEKDSCCSPTSHQSTNFMADHNANQITSTPVTMPSASIDTSLLMFKETSCFPEMKTRDPTCPLNGTAYLVEASPDHCRSCAVVGNSGNLNGSCYGPLIDSHDIIIRMNEGRTKGYEGDVGKRTTHHVMYPESAVDLEDGTHLVLFAFKVMDLHWLFDIFSPRVTTSQKKWKTYAKANKDLVRVLHPAFIRYVHEKWLEKDGEYPSTGFLTLVMTLHMCDKVSVFGFGADSGGHWNHYWNKLAIKYFTTSQHPRAHEYKLIQQLSERQIVKFHKGK